MLIKRFTPSRESVATAMKRLSMMLVLCFLLGTAHAGTFSANGGQGTSTIGPAPGDDYPSLAAAAADFSGYAGGCTGDWTLLINTPILIEPDNVAFGNATNGYNVTMKPASGITAQVQFTKTTEHASGTWSGKLLIGTASTTALQDELTSTSNFTIDGSNNGTTSRDLTITNDSIDFETQLIRVVGGCNNTTIKNVILNSIGTSLNFPIEFTERRTATDIDHIPSGCVVDNCDITAATGTNVQAILFRQVSASGHSILIGEGPSIENVTITSNTIFGKSSCVNLGMVGSALVTDNILSGSPTYYAGIYHLGWRDGYTITITRNKFVYWNFDDTSGLAPQVELDLRIEAPMSGTYNINNNFFAGFQTDGTGDITTGGSYRGIHIKCSSPQSSAVTNIYHNSFSMPNIPRLKRTNACASYYAVGINTTNIAYGFYGTVNVKDNIFVMEQNNAVVFFRTSTSAGPGTLVSDYNTFYLGSVGAKMACYINTGANQVANYATLADWQDAGFDTHSLIADPRVAPTPEIGKWVSSTDLHFDAPANDIFSGVDVGIATDIDGETRVVPVIGADEVPVLTPTNAHGWDLYQ
jgi:hypothetical protein